MRIMQPKLEKALGTNLLIANRGGAGGTIGVGLAAKAAPDGYTLLVTSASFTFAPSLYKKLTYDAIKDFRPITNLADAPLVLAVHPSVSVKTLPEFLDLARKKPGEINYASAGVGSNIHMTTELFQHMAKISLNQVPYKGGGPATMALISGEVQVVITGILSAIPFIKQGRMRALAVTTKVRSPLYPDLPSISEFVPGYDKGGWTGMYAPAKVPQPIIDHIYGAVSKVLKDPEMVKRFTADGLIPVGNTPDQFAAFVQSEITEWGKLIKTMDIKL